MEREVSFTGTPRYQVEAEIGHGGMGRVYRVYDHETRTRLALKTLRRRDSEQERVLKEEFRKGKLHPNLVELNELVVDEHHCFFTMELLQGKNLLDYVGIVEVPVEPELSVTIKQAHARPSMIARAVSPTREQYEASIARLEHALRQLVRGIAALHASGLVHRDIKPSNIIVTDEGRVVLLDFGLVTSWSERDFITPRFELAGTLAYMAPEQMQITQARPAGDWYSVGVLLYRLMTGQLPFEGDQETMRAKKLSADFVRPRQLRPEIPERFEQLILSLLQPDPKIRGRANEIARALGDDLTPSMDLDVEGLSFVGRQRELELLHTLFEKSASGRSTVALIEGASGFGKTELIRAALSRVQASAYVLTARCHPRESVPYNAFDGIVDALATALLDLSDEQLMRICPPHPGSLLRVFPALSRVTVFAESGSGPEALDPQELRFRAFEALRALLGELAAMRPIVVWIDHVQWSDKDSELLLGELLDAVRGPPLMVVLSYRSEDGAHHPVIAAVHALADKLGPERVEKIAVGPLDERSCRALAAEILQPLEDIDAMPAKLADEIATAAGGSPFFVSQLAHYFVEDPRRAETVAVDERALGFVLEDRLQRLSADARAIVELVSVAAGPISRSIALRASGAGESARGEINRLVDRSLIRLVDTGRDPAIEIYHSKSREAILSRLDGDSLRNYHRKLADAIRAANPAAVDALAHHYDAAGDISLAGHFSLEAARIADRALAFDKAAALYARAAELRPNDPALPELHAECAEALANAGRGGDAGRRYVLAADGVALRDPGSARVIELRRRAAEQFLRAGHVAEGVELLRMVLAASGVKWPETSRDALFRVMTNKLRLKLRGLEPAPWDPARSKDLLKRSDVCWSAGLGLSWVDGIRRVAFQAQFSLAALSSGEPGRAARALATEASELACFGGPARTEKSHIVLAKAVELVASADDPAGEAFVTLMGATIDVYEAQWKSALEKCVRAEDILRNRCQGVSWELTTSHILSLLSLAYLGRFKELQEKLPALIQGARQRGDLLAEATLSTGFPNMCWLAADRPEEARAVTEGAMSKWPNTDFQLQHYLHLVAEAQIDLYLGDGRAALARLEQNWDALDRSYHLKVQHFRITLWHLRARALLVAAAAQADKKLIAAARADANRVRSEAVPWARALAAALFGEIAALTGEPARGAAELEAAAVELAALDMPAYALAARAQAGMLRGGAAGEAQVAEAAAAMRACGIADPAKMAMMLVPC